MQRSRYGALSVLVLLVMAMLPAVADDPAVPKPSPREEEAAQDVAPEGVDERETQSAGEEPYDADYYRLLRMFVDTLDQVERNYVQDLSRRELLEAAIDGMLGKLDEHSDYIAPGELDRFKSSVESEFGGIGIQVSRQPDGLKIISPLVGSPAYRAGLMAGDVITGIEGDSAADLSLEEAVLKMKGPVGTNVKLTVRHPDTEEFDTIELTREIVRVETVLGQSRKNDDSWNFMLDPEKKLGYVRVTAFARHTVSDLRAAIKALEQEGMRGLILDLRFNPGGLLSSAIQTSDLFVKEGRIVSTEGRNAKPRIWDAQPKGTFDDFPMVVLVNQYSASASEIVAACLQDHNRAVVIGERTFGKGSVQNIIELENGRSALKLTTAGYQRPSGKNIHRFPDADDDDEWGVTPNPGYTIEVSELDIEKLIRFRQKVDIARRGLAPEEGEEDEPVEDVILTKAIDYLKSEIDEAASEVAAETKD